MQINPNVAKTPEGLKELALKKMKAYIKKDLKRLEQKTTPEKPITVMVWGDYAYTDKPAGAGLIVFGKWKGDFKNFAKKEVIASDLGAIGQAYFGGVDADGQKIIKVDLAKGKGKNKHEKLKKGLKKLIPQATFNVVFGEMEEDAIESLDKKMDAEVDLPEVITDDESSTDEGQIELEVSTNVDGLLRSNLEEISKTVVAIKAAVTAKDYPTAQEDIPDLLDLCDEWFEIYRESLPAVQGAYSEAYAKVTKIKEDVAKLSEQLATASSQPNATGTNAGSTISATLQKGSKGDDVKTLQRLLIGLGYNLGSAKDDGDFGSKTHDAVVAVQKKYNLSQTGIVAPGSDTWKAITGKLPLPPQNVVTDAGATYVSDGKTYDNSKKAAEIGKELHQDSQYWTKVKLTDGTVKVVSPDEYKQLKKDKKIKSVVTTWCNQLAYELSERILGENSPFKMMPMGEGWTNANNLTTFMREADGVLVDKISGSGRFKTAWEEINRGKMVYFCYYNPNLKDDGVTHRSGHVATGVPTPIESLKPYRGDFIGRITQAGSSVGEMWLNEGFGDLGDAIEVYVGKLQTPSNEKPNPNLLLAIYDKITEPVGRGVTPKGSLNDLQTVHKLDAERMQVVCSNVKTVQQMLINAAIPGVSKADGNCGDKTIAGIEEAQRRAGVQPVTGVITYGDATWNYLMGISKPLMDAAKEKATGVKPTPALEPSAVKFQTKGTAQALKPNVDAILRDIFAKAGEANPVVISTYRSDEEQASIMYQNLEAYGEKNNRKGYKNKSAAGEVIDAYVAAKAANKSAAEVTGAILAAIKKVGAANISAHCNASNPAIDILPSSIKNKGNFESIIKADPRVMVICPPKDVSYHIEVK